MIVYSTKIEDLPAAVADGRVRCGGCGGWLAPWGHARGRLIRDGARASRWWRPARARCRACGATHVLLSAALLPRRRDSVRVIGQVLRGVAAGRSDRTLAAVVGVPVSTVRNWRRAAAGHAQELRVVGTSWYYELDAVAAPLSPAGSPLGDAVEALGAAARAAVLRFGPFDRPWAIINVITAGRLLRPPLGPPC